MKNRGFSLIELVVTIGIIGILASIAYPSYTSYTQRAHRTDATATMTSYAQGLERCYSQFFTYINSAATPCPVPVGATVSPQGYYTVTVAPVAAAGAVAASYTITATPVATGPQIHDSSCQNFTLNSAGTQAATNGAAVVTTQTCWGSN